MPYRRRSLCSVGLDAVGATPTGTPFLLDLGAAVLWLVQHPIDNIVQVTHVDHIVLLGAAREWEFLDMAEEVGSA